jgi:hypothetical protein
VTIATFYTIHFMLNPNPKETLTLSYSSFYVLSIISNTQQNNYSLLQYPSPNTLFNLIIIPESIQHSRHPIQNHPSRPQRLLSITRLSFCILVKVNTTKHPTAPAGAHFPDIVEGRNERGNMTFPAAVGLRPGLNL